MLDLIKFNKTTVDLLVCYTNVKLILIMFLDQNINQITGYIVFC